MQHHRTKALVINTKTFAFIIVAALIFQIAWHGNITERKKIVLLQRQNTQEKHRTLFYYYITARYNIITSPRIW